MFTIEYVVLAGRDHPGVVERMITQATRVDVAEATAESQLQRVRRMRARVPPDGYQIRDRRGDVVLRSWDNTQRRG